RRPLASGIGRLGTAAFSRHWLSAGHLLRQPSECAGAGQGAAAGPRDDPRHRRRAHAASLSIAQLVFGAEKASRDQAGRAPRWRLLEARRPGGDIIAGASLARRKVNLPLSVVKIRLWLPGRFVVARAAAVSKKCCPLRGDRGFESGFLHRRVACEPENDIAHSEKRAERGEKLFETA